MTKAVEQNKKLRSNDSEASPSSPKLGSTRRNYFRRDQVNKALVDSLRKSRDSETSSLQHLAKKSNEEDRARRNVSKHDQTNGIHEHHDSQHEESKLTNVNLSNEGGEPAQVETLWHDVQVVESEAGDQELVIENLENLDQAT